MHTKRLFFFVPFLISIVFASHAQKMGLHPLSQYSVDIQSDMQLRTTAAVQKDTLKIPYIEDFSGYGLPIDSISVDTFYTTPANLLVYRVTHLKMHGLKSSDSIRVYNSTGGTATSTQLNGLKYVKVINKYSFQLFNNKALSVPSTVLSGRAHYLNWIRLGKQGYSSSPDTLGFLDNSGGVFINNDMALNPISIGVATFDGVNSKGIPYSTTTTKGYSDNLTSLPFNLSGYTASSNIYMSFYWQSKSLGDSPISSEFLALEFKNAAGNWVEMWRQYGATETEDTFKIAMVPILNPSYLHKGFQYRFRSYGVQNGRFCVWNLDYIYINKDRSVSSPYLRDISIITTNRSALKNYTSVPYKHMKTLPAPAIADETAGAFLKIRDTYNNYSSTVVPIERKHYSRDNLNPYPDDTIIYKNEPGTSIQDTVFTQTYDNKIIGSRMTKPYVLKEEFYFQPLDTIGPIDMTFNNFTAIETYFYDYYSYDDGTPEYAFLSTNPGGTKVAVGYKILKADVLTHIEYGFIKNNGPDLTNSVLILNVWMRDSSAGVGPMAPFKLIEVKEQIITIRYSSTINGTVRYELDTPLQLNAGTYYFGYTQNFINPLFLGYDKNTDHLDNIFFCNDGVTWQPFTDINLVPGALMIHPVFYDHLDSTITAIDDKQTLQNQFTFYPNPAQSELHLTGQPEYISIYDLSGLLLLEKKITDEEILSIESLKNGLYLIIFSKDGYQEVKRLIIQK